MPGKRVAKGPLASVDCEVCGSPTIFASGGRATPIPCVCPACTADWAKTYDRMVGQLLRRSASCVRVQARRLRGKQFGEVRRDLFAVARELTDASRTAKRP